MATSTSTRIRTRHRREKETWADIPEDCVGTACAKPREESVMGLSLRSTSFKPDIGAQLFASGKLLSEELDPSISSVDIVKLCSERLGYDVGKKEVGELAPSNQKREERCVAHSITLGMYLKAINSTEDKALLEWLRKNSPSIVHAYHSQSFYEHKTTGRCACGDACGGRCDPLCGTRMSAMLKICKDGVVPSSIWPLSKNGDLDLIGKSESPSFLERNDTFSLKDYAPIPLNSRQEDVVTATLSHLARGTPVLASTRIFPNQRKFNVTHLESKEEDWASIVMPSGRGAALPTGHAILFVGFDRDLELIHVRNSFGENWGANGDFAIPFAMLNNRQFFPDFVAITDVDIVRGV